MLHPMPNRGRPSLARQRHELIVSQVRRQGGARVVELAAQLDVSEMTVRRDLDALHDAGLIVKVHGGATVRYEHSTDEPGFEAKFSQNLAEKRAIAASAAVLTGSGARRSGITAGTTTVQLAAELVSVPNLTVVTNSIRVADVFHAAPSARSHGDPDRRRAHSQRRARRAGRRRARCARSTSTRCSWACTASTSEPVSPPPT